MSKSWLDISTKLVTEPDNFQLWESLIVAAESPNGNMLTKASTQEEITTLRTSYILFLEKFPFLHKYWVKYADWEFMLGFTDSANDVFEQAVIQMPFSLEIWLSFTKFKVDTEKNDRLLLRAFERARRAIGNHYHAHEFYDLYLQFLRERSHNEECFKKKYYLLLRTIIEIPLYHFSKFYKLFMQDVITKRNFHYILPQEELGNYPISKDESAIRLKKLFTDTYITTQYKSFELFAFEKRLGRPYFHVAYVSTEKLDIWNNYLDLIELKYPDYAELTYNRCLVATAMYDTFWLRYVDYLLGFKKVEEAKQVLLKAINCVPMTQNSKIILRLIDLQLFQGNVLAARDTILENLSLFPNSVAFKLKFLSIERLLHPKEDDYILELASKLDLTSYIYQEILNYGIEYSKLKAFFMKIPQDSNEYYQSLLDLIVFNEGITEEAKSIYKNACSNKEFSTKWKSLINI